MVLKLLQNINSIQMKQLNKKGIFFTSFDLFADWQEDE